jgi:dTDP-glucose 4,6-dehydratase
MANAGIRIGRDRSIRCGIRLDGGELSRKGISLVQVEPRRIMVTGGAGFIGSNYVRYLLSENLADEVRVFDKLTYSGNRTSLNDLSNDNRFSFIQGDICDESDVMAAVSGCDAVVNFAAETHVDRSLLEPAGFIQTNVRGTWVLLEAVRQSGDIRFVQVSTDEVYGAVLEGYSTEDAPLYPRNPYSASKAGGEMMVISYVETHGVDALISRGSNTFGPYQYPEKFIPLMITNVIENRPVPVYGDGLQVRHWIHVDDHCSGIDTVLRKGSTGGIYNIGSDDERTNLSVAQQVLDHLDAPHDLIQHVTDRPGHDRRYALSSKKLRALGWEPRWSFDEGLRATVAWYRERRDWWGPIRDAAFDSYYEKNYGGRTTTE